MIYLEIAEETRKLSGLQGKIESVKNVTGIYDTLLTIINAEYNSIQVSKDSWSWMFLNGQIPLSEFVNTYENNAIETYHYIRYNYSDLKYIEYTSWIPVTGTKPDVFTIVPETNQLIFNTVDSSYVLDFRGKRNIDTLSDNQQEPIIPVSYQRVLVYKAAASMSAILGNGDLVNKNLTDYDVMYGQLCRATNLPKQIKQYPLV